MQSRPNGWSGYEFLFGETFAGSARLTDAMRSKLPKGKVREPRDILYGKQWDLLEQAVYDRAKKEAKQRLCYYNHYSPKCATFSPAQRHYMERSKALPYGAGERYQVEQDNKLAVRTCALCRMHHAVGDSFSIEHIYPSLMLEFGCYKEL